MARSRTWPAFSLAAVAMVGAIAALIVALARPTATSTTTVRTFTAAEIAAAQQQLCDTYKLAARAVNIETHGGGQALADVASVNGAAMLDSAAANPALDSNHRDAARALAAAYRNTTAVGSYASASDPAWQSAVDDANAKDAAMKNVCPSG